MGAKADLHTHTICSDGALSPYELVKKAKAGGLSAISITDHDSVAAIPDALEFGKEFGVEIISGVELSATFEDKEVHILGYFVDYKSQRLLDYLTFFRHERIKRAERIVAKLNNLQVPLSIESVMEHAGTGSVGRPHIAAALVDEGITKSYQESFDRYIGNGGPAYERKFQFSPAEAVQLVASSGGLSFLAHPGRYTTDGMLQHLIKAGIDGIEVIHPSHTQEHMLHYRGVVSEYYLLESGGSDFHGGKKNDEAVFGNYFVDGNKVDAMKRRLFLQRSA
ncbi:MAG TPA: PHP domain-containing protein [Bacteroidota bacterium]|nr:PHP domain-containing protein [Bacteroidota bacterium]